MHENDPDNLTFPTPSERLPFTGERYTSDIFGPIRHQHHHRYLFAARFCVGRDVLDIACGEGYGSAMLGSVARSVCGVDIDPGAVAFAERNYAAANVFFRQGDAEHFEQAQTFDVIVSFETIEHLVDHHTFIEGLRRVLRPGGLLIISSPDRIIYTEADGHENVFHRRELDRAEFKELVGQRFANVAMFEQDSVVGSLIGPEEGGAARLELFASDDGRTYRRSAGMPRAHYLIALASDNPLPLGLASALDDMSWMHMSQGHEAHAVALAREVGSRDAEIQRLNEALSDTAIVKRELDVRNAEIQRLKQEYANLRREFDQRQNLIDERDRYLEKVFASTSWKITGPVRRIGHIAATLRRRKSVAPAPATVLVPVQRIRAPKDHPCILFVDWVVPTPDQDSGSLDLWHQFSLFRTLGYSVAFLPMIERATDAQYIDALRRAGVDYLSDATGISPEQRLEELADNFDLIFLNRVHVAVRLIAQIRACAPNARIVFNTIDLHFLREERQAALEGSKEKAREAARRREEELRCIVASDATIVLSNEEQRLLAGLAPDADIHVIPFARCTSDFVPPFKERSGVLFVGGFLHTPNIDATHRLVTDIWPIVRRALPTAALEIVGSNTPPEIYRLDAPENGVHVRGFMEDLAPVLSRVRLTVAPLRYGAGIKGKVAMSLAAGVPCVATQIAVEGMSLTAGDNILVGQTPEELAAAIIRLHEDALLWADLSARGQMMMREHYSLERVGRCFLKVVRSLGVVVPGGADEKLLGIKPYTWTALPGAAPQGTHATNGSDPRIT